MRAYGVLVLALVAACRSNAAGAGDSSSGPATLQSAAVFTAPTLKGRMREHDLHAGAARDAVARADLATASREARVLADMRLEGAEPTWRDKLEAMSRAAARVADAKSVGDAARALGALTRTCGDCHATLGRPPPAVGEPPRDTDTAAARMQRHSWAAQRLWDGLVGPSEDAWRAGARVLADAPLALPDAGPSVGTLAASMHDLGRKAGTAATDAARADVYGDVIGACSGCHGLHGGGPR
jgi:hypothetical protein